MEDIDDKILYNNFLEGDMKSFEIIVKKYAEKIIYFIFGFVKEIDIAEDLSQDVFLHILVNKEKYDFKYSLKTWLFIIARSRSLDYLRKNKRRLVLETECLKENELELLENIEDEVFKNIRNNNLKLEIQKLPNMQRKSSIFILYRRINIQRDCHSFK